MTTTTTTTTKRTLTTTPRRSLASPAPTTTATSTTSSANPSQPAPLNWNDFLRLRKIRRRYNLGASLATALLGGAAGVVVLASQNLEALGAQLFGLDPIIVMGLGTSGFLGLGWLLGPLLGTAVFRVVHRSVGEAMAVVSICSPLLGV